MSEEEKKFPEGSLAAGIVSAGVAYDSLINVYAEKLKKAEARAAELEGLLAQLAELWDTYAYHDDACSVRVAGGRRGCNCGYAEASTKVQAALAPLPTPHMGEGVQK